MIRALLVLALAGLSGCSTYIVRPFYSADLKKMVCCEALVQDGRDLTSLSLDATENNGNYAIHFQEAGVSASAPIAAGAAGASAVAGAVTSAVGAAAKISLP